MFGVLNLSFWGYVIATILLCQITCTAVTIYLHRYQTHRALTLHPIVSHFFRFWLWLTTGMVTAEWVAIHRKHHAMTDVEGDPHSPQLLGLKKVLFEGAELYRECAKDKAMIEKYSHGTPNDWIENHLYKKYSARGIILLFGLNLLLFGIPGITIWALQMLWVPFHAAGVINGVGHYWGYRNFECTDAARNILPFGLWMGGEELHNNHHSFPSSAKFSIKWWEFDFGWVLIRCLSFLKLARVKKLPPQLISNSNKGHVDIDTVKAVIANRLQIMSQYYKRVIRPVLKAEKKSSQEKKYFSRAGRLLRRHNQLLSPTAKEKLNQLLENTEQLKTAYHFNLSLQNVWLKTAKSQRDLVEALQQWCKQAEESGLEALHQFAQQIKSYVPHRI